MTHSQARLRTYFSTSVRRLLSTVALAATVLPGCAETPVEQPLVGYQLRTTELWSGGDLVLTSPSIPQIHETIRVVVNGDTFPSVYRRGDSIVFRPDVPGSGTYRISVVPALLPVEGSSDVVTIRGMAACYPGPQMSGYPLPWPERYRLSTFVADGAESAIIVDAATGESRPAVPPSAHNPGIGMGPGWTTEPLSVVLSGSIVDGVTGTCVWRLEPSPEPIECREGAYSRYTLAQLGTGNWVFAGHHHTDVIWGDTTRSTNWLEGPDGLILSPHGDHVIVSGASPDGQLLVSAEQNGRVARSPFLFSSDAPAAFTPDGDTVFMVGSAEYASPPLLVVFDPRAPSELIARIDLGTTDASDIAVDPAAPVLYVLGFDGVITVLDRGSLHVTGRLRPDSSGCEIPPYTHGNPRLRLARNTSTLYVVNAWAFRAPAANSWIYKYDLVTPRQE